MREKEPFVYLAKYMLEEEEIVTETIPLSEKVSITIRETLNSYRNRQNSLQKEIHDY